MTSEGDVQPLGEAGRCGAVDGREGETVLGRTPASLDWSRAWQSVGEAGRCGVGARELGPWNLVEVKLVGVPLRRCSAPTEHSRFQVWHCSEVDESPGSGAAPIGE